MQVTNKRRVPERTSHKILETKSIFHLKEHTTGKVQFLFFNKILLELTKFTLGYHSMKFRHFPDVS